MENLGEKQRLSLWKKEPELLLVELLGVAPSLPRWHVNSWILRVDLIWSQGLFLLILEQMRAMFFLKKSTESLLHSRILATQGKREFALTLWPQHFPTQGESVLLMLAATCAALDPGSNQNALDSGKYVEEALTPLLTRRYFRHG